MIRSGFQGFENICFLFVWVWDSKIFGYVHVFAHVADGYGERGCGEGVWTWRAGGGGSGYPPSGAWTRRMESRRVPRGIRKAKGRPKKKGSRGLGRSTEPVNPPFPP